MQRKDHFKIACLIFFCEPRTWTLFTRRKIGSLQFWRKYGIRTKTREMAAAVYLHNHIEVRSKPGEAKIISLCQGKYVLRTTLFIWFGLEINTKIATKIANAKGPRTNQNKNQNRDQNRDQKCRGNLLLGKSNDSWFEWSLYRQYFHEFGKQNMPTIKTHFYIYA